MVQDKELREGELAVEMPPPRDAGLIFIGRIRTPWTSREDTPRQGRHDGPVCRLEIFEPWVPALKGVDFYTNLEVIYWLHSRAATWCCKARRTTDRPAARFRCARRCGRTRSAPRSSSWSGRGQTVLVRGLDCLDETPLLDIKPDRCEFTPLAARKAGDVETE